ncbi:MAG: hypothetical protein ACK2T0_11000 [Anaerolineales bacterium]|jgi:hypothetical protein
MGKFLLVILFLVVGLAIGLWLALGAQTPGGVTQSWAQVKNSAQQLWADAGTRLREAQPPAFEGGPPGPSLLDRITTPFAAFATGVQGLWGNLGKSIRPAP